MSGTIASAVKPVNESRRRPVFWTSSAARRRRKAAEGLYRIAVAQAREPAFYERFGVPDTLDGRFDMVALHVFLLMRRLKGEPGEPRELAQALVDYMFDDFDNALREMGVGDLGVARRIKDMLSAFYGRVGAYDSALADGTDALDAALRRNLYRGEEPDEVQVVAMGAYVRRAVDELKGVSVKTLSAGDATFPPPPEA